MTGGREEDVLQGRQRADQRRSGLLRALEGGSPQGTLVFFSVPRIRQEVGAKGIRVEDNTEVGEAMQGQERRPEPVLQKTE